MECHLTTHPKINGLNSNASVDNSNLIPKLFKMPKQHLWKEARAGCYTGTFGAMCFVVSLLHNKYPFHEYSSILAHYREQGLKIASAWAWTCSQLHTDTRLSSPAMERKKEKKSWNNDLSFPLSCRNRGMAGALRSLNRCVVTKLVFLELEGHTQSTCIVDIFIYFLHRNFPVADVHWRTMPNTVEDTPTHSVSPFPTGVQLCTQATCVTLHCLQSSITLCFSGRRVGSLEWALSITTANTDTAAQSIKARVQYVFKVVQFQWVDFSDLMVS